MSRRLRFAAGTAVLAGALWVPGGGAGAPPPPLALCTIPAGATSLPAGANHGLVKHLQQYPDVSLATPAQRAAARGLLARARRAALVWRDPRRAKAAGFDTRTVKRAKGDRSVHYLHAEHRRYSGDGVYLDPQRPESLIYANAPGRPLVLVGVMFSVPRGVLGRTPGGPITRWHRHNVCAKGRKRGLDPLPDGSCPRGAHLIQGSEMMHLWFTRDLRSAYAIHAPGPELCAAHLLAPGQCVDPARIVGM